LEELSRRKFPDISLLFPDNSLFFPVLENKFPVLAVTSALAGGFSPVKIRGTGTSLQ
jgi:hypothetical protein